MVAAAFAGNADHNDRNRPSGHLLPQKSNAVHSRHDHIQDDNIGLKRFHHCQRFLAVAGRTNDINKRASKQHFLDDFAHVCRVVNHQYSNQFIHFIPA